MSDIRCPQCDALNRDTARYCAECGTPLLEASKPEGRSTWKPIVTEEEPIAAAEKLTAGAEKPTAEAEEPIAGVEKLTAEAGGSISLVSGEQQTAPLPVSTSTGEEEELLLGRYRLIEELGRGSSGAVYAAWDTHLNRKCALKEILAWTPEAQRQFIREAAALVSLSHPHLAGVIDHFSIRERGQYLVMDFVEGDDLERRVRREGRQPLVQALTWTLQVASALAYLQSQQPPIVHRDIKPANIRITPEGQAVLVDFGLAGGLEPHRNSSRGSEALTLGYLPPEQYGGGTVDGRSDIYALGATLYTLLSGLSPTDSTRRAAGDQLMPIREVNREVSPSIDALVQKAVEVEPAARYQSAAEFAEALQGCLSALQPATRGESVEAGAPPPAIPRTEVILTTPRPAPPLAQKPAARRRLPWGWVALAGFLLVGLMGALLIGGLTLWARSMATSTPTRAVRANLGLPSATPEPGSTATTRIENTPLPVFRSKDPQVYVHLAVGEPDTLDPGLDYETAGQQIITNIYDTLIFYEKDDPNRFVPQLALEVPSLENGGISSDGRSYRFEIRPGVKFHNGNPLTVEDVAFTFQRNLLQGGSDSAQWLFSEPLLGAGIYDAAQLIDRGLVDRPEELARQDPEKLREVCQTVKEAVQVEAGTNAVIFRLAQPWSPFLATLASGNGSILSREWVTQNGGWDGDCETWQDFYGRSAYEINQTNLGKQAMGSGPFRLDHWTWGEEIVLRANESYWRREPAWRGGPAGPPAIKRVVIKQIADFEARLAQLEAGEADSIDLDSNADRPRLDPRVGMICSLNDDDCSPGENPDGPLEMVRGGPSVSRSDIFLTWQINAQGGNEYLGSGKLDGDGIPPDFFANVHVRRAFASCFNYNRYLNEYLFGEGIRTINLMLPGMVGYNPQTPFFSYDPSRCEQELRQAQFGDRTVWQTGFRFVFPTSDVGNGERQIIAQIFGDELARLDERFKIELRENAGSDYFNQQRESRLPIYIGSWLEDIHDPHNWLIPYTLGTFGRFQGLPDDLLREFEDFITRGVTALDPAGRSVIYQGFNKLYSEQAPAILLYSTVNRHYQQRWVNGWYDNTIYPGLYFYALSKD